MTALNKQALRINARLASAGEWIKESGDGWEAICSSDDQANAGFIIAHLEGPDAKENREFIQAANPATVLALLDELDKKQQYIKLRDQENEDIALTVGKLRVELEHYKSREERVTKLVLDNSTSWDVLYEKLEAAERRIAELEAKLETADKLQDSAFRDGLKAGFSYGQTDDQSGFAQCMSAYSNAGIGVKQQEDSVDSDVGRNQPGMVVAVHIGAGDFVKVKGQVFEVEETDFDDHDVTLWFVGGNVLKCAAGCPVDVVSAPVAAGIKVKES
ncbi:ead/Ea22-like family protein [Salmonella enterica]|nr:ead/Ea22-like family protein [Salmonella enterica]